MLEPEIADRAHAEQAEKIKQRDIKILEERNKQRYQDAYDDAEAFFNTMYPLAVKHANSMTREKNKASKSNLVLTHGLLLGYLHIWNTMLSRKYI